MFVPALVRSVTDSTGDRGEAREHSRDDTLQRLFRDGRTNAVLAWPVVGVLAAVFVESVLGDRWSGRSG